jgi:uncharacterized protein
MRIFFLIPFIAAHSITFAQIDQGLSELVINRLAINDVKSAHDHFDEKMKSKLSEEQLIQIWKTLTVRHGNFVKIIKTQSNVLQDSVLKVESYCIFENGKIIIQTSINLITNKIIGLFFRPDYIRGDYQLPNYIRTNSYIEKQLNFKKNDSSIIQGTITWPNNKLSFTLVILIPGSGQVDRDVTIASNKPFKDIALSLSSNGVASYRYDKSTFTNRRFTPNSFEEEYIDDLDYLLNQFKKNDSIDSIILLGHSLGTLAAIIEATKNKYIDGLILMACGARPLEDLIIEQTDYLLKHSAVSQDDSLTLIKLKDAAIKVKLKQYDQDISFDPLPLKMKASYWKSLEPLIPTHLCKQLSIPILFMQGKRDYQVNLIDFEIWKADFRHKKNANFILYEQLNHLFFEGTGYSVPKEYLVTKNIPEYVISDIIKWLQRIE